MRPLLVFAAGDFELEQMHHLKTGALLRASGLLGALCGKALSENEVATAGCACRGQQADLCFDIELGKSLAFAGKLRQHAHQALVPFREKARRLRELADLIVQRKA